MKYMQTGGFQANPFMRQTLLWTLLFMAGLWVTNCAMYFSRMGLDPASVASYYLGSEAEFRPPRSAASMLEVTHAHLPVMGLVVLLLTHLAIFAPIADRAKTALITAGFLSAFANEGAGWLVRFVHPGFAWLKVLAFVAFQSVLALLILALAAYLLGWGERRRAGPRFRGFSRDLV